MRQYLLLPILGLTACHSAYTINPDAIEIVALAETTPVASGDDAADDPAIWVNPANPEKSLVLGTNKKLGLAVYNLAGDEVQFLERGRLNNVDLRQGITLDNGKVTLAVATNRTEGAMDVFSIADSGRVEFVLQQPLTLADPYGICMSVDTNGRANVFVNSTEGEYQQWLLNPGGMMLNPQFRGTFLIATQPEGCAVDDATGMLYMGEEDRGVWMMPADATRAEEKMMLDRTGAGHLTADVEGMDVYRDDAGHVYLVVSSQGDNSYGLYDLAHDNAWLGSFRIADNPAVGVDGTQETDGLAVTSRFLGDDYAQGLLVVHDGYNELPHENQNFKLVPWQTLQSAFDLE